MPSPEGVVEGWLDDSEGELSVGRAGLLGALVGLSVAAELEEAGTRSALRKAVMPARVRS